MSTFTIVPSSTYISSDFDGHFAVTKISQAVYLYKEFNNLLKPEPF